MKQLLSLIGVAALGFGFVGCEKAEQDTQDATETTGAAGETVGHDAQDVAATTGEDVQTTATTVAGDVQDTAAAAGEDVQAVTEAIGHGVKDTAEKVENAVE